MTAQSAGRRADPAPRVVVVVGTDHHPFGRLIEWVNDWLRLHPEQAPGFFVQSGTAPVTPACRWSRFLDIDQLDLLLDQADVMVCHGGPASISNAWSRGQLPIVVPRLRRFGEHVDDHQRDFCRKVADLGRIRLAETPAALTGLLAEAARDISGFRLGRAEAVPDQAVARFAALVDELVSQPRRRLTSIRPVRRPRRLVTGNGLPAAAGDLPSRLAPPANVAQPPPARRATPAAGIASKEKA